MLQLTEKLRIITDDNNVILQERKFTRQDHREYWEAIAYTGTYAQMLHVVVNRKVKGVASLEELVQRIDELHKMIDELARSLSRMDKMPKDEASGE